MQKVVGKVIFGDSRNMSLVEDQSIHLIVTSPPYWHIKDYGVQGQIGYGQTLHEYLIDLFRVWKECFRVLKPGRRLCINVGDQFTRSSVYGTYKIIPIHSEIIAQCEMIGFDYMGSIIWQKKTTMNTTGGANIMGSYPYPPNGMLEIDYEYILVFKKPGFSEQPQGSAKELSRLEKEEWKTYFNGHWYFAGARQVDHEAMFPEELPKRLIKMYSFVGENVLDPFLGSGTTVKVALELGRNGIGYEINKDYADVIRRKLGVGLFLFSHQVEFIDADNQDGVNKIVSEGGDEAGYIPRIKDMRPINNSLSSKREERMLYKVTEIIDEKTLKLENGLVVELLGVTVVKKDAAVNYLREYVLGKRVFIKFDSQFPPVEEKVRAYVYLKNKIFVNAYMVKSGLALADRTTPFDHFKKFLQIEQKSNVVGG